MLTTTTLIFMVALGIATTMHMIFKFDWTREEKDSTIKDKDKDFFTVNGIRP